MTTFTKLMVKRGVLNVNSDEYDQVHNLEERCLDSGECFRRALLDIPKILMFDEPEHIYTNYKRFDRWPFNNYLLNSRGFTAFRVAFSNYAFRMRKLPDDRLYHPGILKVDNFLESEIDLSNFPEFVNKQPSNLTAQHFPEVHFQMKERVLGALGWRDNYEANLLFDQNTFVQRVRNVPDNTDQQKDAHADTFFPAIKYWYFPEEVSLEHGPFHYAFGSCNPSLKVLEFWYEQSLRISDGSWDQSRRVDHLEGSLRATEEELEHMGFEMQPVIVHANTLVIANVLGFHHRGQVTKEHVRSAIHGSIRVGDPFAIPH